MTTRKQDIMEKATLLFAEKGYQGTTTAEIAKAVGISEGAIFRHFKSKEELLQSIFISIRERFFANLEQEFSFRPDEDGLGMVLRLTRIYCKFYETMELEFDFIHANNPYRMPQVGEQCRVEMKRINGKMVELLTIGITLGLKDGSIREMPVRAGAVMVAGLLSGIVRLRLFEKLHVMEIEEEIISFCRQALANDDIH